MSGVDSLLSRLEGVHETGRGRWLAKCPAHQDRRASLSIRELADGRVLVHDFAGCPVAEIVAAVGLALGDLFPERVFDHHVRRERLPFAPLDVLRALADEALVVAIVGARLASDYAVDADELVRLSTAAGRIARAADLFAEHPAHRRRAVLRRDEIEELEYA